MTQERSRRPLWRQTAKQKKWGGLAWRSSADQRADAIQFGFEPGAVTVQLGEGQR